jgi:type VI secretion system ImpA family protein
MTVVTTIFQFDADTLLSPISGDDPTGPSLRYEGTYDLIAGLRREDDPTLAQGVWKTELKRADWPRVAQTCVNALERQSKDLQIAAWLLEAWLRLRLRRHPRRAPCHRRAVRHLLGRRAS